MSNKTGSRSDEVMLGGHRFWNISCDYLGAEFCKRVHDVDIGAWTVAPVPVDHGGSNWQEHAPGQINYADVVVTAHIDPASAGKAQQQFTKQVLGQQDAKGGGYRFPLTINFTTSAPGSAPLFSYDFIDCMVVNWALEGGHSHERNDTYKEILTIRPTRCTVK